MITKQQISKWNKIAKKYDYHVHGDEFYVAVTPNNPTFYSADVRSSYIKDPNSDVYEDIVKFRVAYDGYGTLNDKNDKIYFNNLVNAHNMCDELNKSIEVKSDET